MATPTHFLVVLVAHFGLFRFSNQSLGLVQSPLPADDTSLAAINDPVGTFRHFVHQSEKLPTQRSINHRSFLHPLESRGRIKKPNPFDFSLTQHKSRAAHWVSASETTPINQPPNLLGAFLRYYPHTPIQPQNLHRGFLQ